MPILTDNTEMANANVDDSIFLASYTRIKNVNGMWRKEFDVDGALNEKISKEEIQSMGFALGSEMPDVDYYQSLGITIEGLDYGDLEAPTAEETDIDYGNLLAGSEPDIDYGSITQ